MTLTHESYDTRVPVRHMALCDGHGYILVLILILKGMSGNLVRAVRLSTEEYSKPMHRWVPLQKLFCI